MKLKKFILTKTQVPDAIHKTKDWHPPGFEGLSANEVFHYFRKHVKWQNLLERASSISYYFIMAMPPSLLFLLTIIPNLPFLSNQTVKYQIHAFILDVVPSKVHNMAIIGFVDDLLDHSRIGLLSFGLLAALFFASNAMMAIIRVFNKDYLGFVPRKGLHHRLTAIKLTMMIFGVLFVYMILLILQSSVLKLFIENEKVLRTVNTSRWLMIILMVFFSIALILKFAPTVRKRWKLINPGSVVGTFLSISFTLVFTLFVSNFDRYNALYGAIGTIMMLMALVFINSLILLIAFELNVSIKSVKALKEMRLAKEKANQPTPPAAPPEPEPFSNNRLRNND